MWATSGPIDTGARVILQRAQVLCLDLAGGIFCDLVLAALDFSRQIFGKPGQQAVSGEETSADECKGNELGHLVPPNPHKPNRDQSARASIAEIRSSANVAGNANPS